MDLGRISVSAARKWRFVHFSFLPGSSQIPGVVLQIVCTECTIYSGPRKHSSHSHSFAFTLTQRVYVRWIAALVRSCHSSSDYPDTGVFGCFSYKRHQYTLNARNTELNTRTNVSSLSVQTPFQSSRTHNPLGDDDDPDVTVNPSEQCPPGTIVVGSNAAIFEVYKYAHTLTDVGTLRHAATTQCSHFSSGQRRHLWMRATVSG